MKITWTAVSTLLGTLALLTGGPRAYATGLNYYAQPESAPNFVVVYSGIDFVEDAWFAWTGGTVALNHDISRPGFLIQGFWGTGDYDYLASVPGGKVDADVNWLRGMIGYQTYTNNLRLAGYVGVDWQDNDLNPKDPPNPVSGGETGFIVTGELETVQSRPIYIGLNGQYSTANDWWWSRARAGYRFGQIVLGPEGTFFGNVSFEAQRAGGFVSFPINLKPNMSVEIELSGGYQWIDSDDNGGTNFGGIAGSSNSGYGNISFSTVF